MSSASPDGPQLTPLPAADGVQVWSASLDQPATALQALAAVLDRGEIERADRITDPALRRRFVAARGMLRALLGRHLHLEPASIHLASGPHGKPEIAGAVGRGVHFNVSHSGDRVMYAVGRGRRVGIDIEQVRPVVNLSRIARRFFSPGESAALQALPEADRQAAFFRCWTRKEALVKARGEGVSGSFRRFDAFVAPGDGVQSLDIDGWAVEDLDVDGGYVAAVAVEAHHV